MAGAVYWVGADGNIYYGSGQAGAGVQNLGGQVSGIGKTGNYKIGAVGSTGFESNTLGQSVNATRIDDPNAPTPAGPTNPNGGAAARPDKSHDIARQQAGLTSVDDETAAGVAAIAKALSGLQGQYDTEATTNHKNYQTQSDTNQNNLQVNKQTALVNAAQGRQGLNGTLASLGALNGSGIELENRAVQQGANADLSGAANNFSTNQSGLDTAIGTFDAQDAKRREDAKTAAANAQETARNQGAKNKQQFYTNLANDYDAQGDSANADKYTALASALYPDIAKTNVPSTALTGETAAFTPGTLGSYLSGANTVVSATPSDGNGLPGLVASSPLKKKLQTA